MAATAGRRRQTGHDARRMGCTRESPKARRLMDGRGMDAAGTQAMDDRSGGRAK